MEYSIRKLCLPTTVESLEAGDFMFIEDRDDISAYDKVSCFFNSNNRRYDLLEPLLKENNFTHKEQQQIYQWLIEQGAPYEIYNIFKHVRPDFDPFEYVNEMTNANVFGYLYKKFHDYYPTDDIIFRIIDGDNRNLMNALVTNGYDINPEDISYAIITHSKNIFKYIVKYVNDITPKHYIDAIKSNNLSALKLLLNEAPIIITEKMIALSKHYPAMYKYLYDIQQEKEDYDNIRTAINNGTPIGIETIMASVASGKIDMARLLIKSMTLTDQQAMDLIVTAYNNDHPQIVRDILRMGYHPPLKDIIHQINDFSKVDIVPLLKVYNIDTNVYVYNYILEHTSSIRVIKFILSNGIYPVGPNVERIIKLLQDHKENYWTTVLSGQPVNIKDAYGNDDIVTFYHLMQQGVSVSQYVIIDLFYDTRRFDIIEKLIPFITTDQASLIYNVLARKNTPAKIFEQIDRKFNIDKTRKITSSSNIDTVEYLAHKNYPINAYSVITDNNAKILHILLENGKLTSTTAFIKAAINENNMAVLRELLTYYHSEGSLRSSIDNAVYHNNLPALRMLVTVRPNEIPTIHEDMSPEIKAYLTSLQTPTPVTSEMVKQSRRWLQEYSRFSKKPSPGFASNLITILKSIPTLIIPINTELSPVPPGYPVLADVLQNKPKLYSGALL